MDGGSRLPRKVEPRTSFTAYWPTGAALFERGMPNVNCAFARTSCGKTVKGKSPVLTSLVELADRKQSKYSKDMFEPWGDKTIPRPE
jgi:hypothetical protein